MKLKNSEMAIKVDESMNLYENDTTSHRKSFIKSTINNIREKLDILGSKILKNKKKSIRKRIRIDETIINEDDDLEDSDIDNISGLLNRLEKYLLKERRHYDHATKYEGIDEVRYFIDEDEDEDYYEPK